MSNFKLDIAPLTKPTWNGNSLNFLLKLSPWQVFSLLVTLVHLIQRFSNLASHLKHLGGIENIPMPGPLLNQLN